MRKVLHSCPFCKCKIVAPPGPYLFYDGSDARKMDSGMKANLESKFLCRLCGESITESHGRYCWPSDAILISKTSESRADLERRGYNKELATFRLEYVNLREQIFLLLRLLDERLAPAAYAAHKEKI